MGRAGLERAGHPGDDHAGQQDRPTRGHPKTTKLYNRPAATPVRVGPTPTDRPCSDASDSPDLI